MIVSPAAIESVLRRSAATSWYNVESAIWTATASVDAGAAVGGSDTIKPDEIVIEIITAETAAASGTQFVADFDDVDGEMSGGAAAGEGVADASRAGAPHSSGADASRRSAGASAGTASSSSSSASSSAHQHHQHHHAFTEVTAIDSFAKGKVLNFLKRLNKFSKPQELFTLSDEREVQEDGSESLLVRCRLRLTLPHPHRSAVAEGIAQTDKDAEHLAAMHAQLIIDALGIPLFGLPSMQQRHADAARAAGRWAPGPNDKMKPQGTPLPPPLRMATLSQEAVSGSGGASRDDQFQEAPQQAAAEEPAAPPAADEQQQLNRPCAAETEEQQAPQQQPATDAAVPPPSSCSPSEQQGEAAPASSSVAAAETTPASSPAVMDTATAEAEAATVAEHLSSAQQLYHLAPWVYSALHRPPPLGANVKDATEAGAFQLVNVLSTRCSASRVALSLPCIFDKASLDRVCKALEFTSSSNTSSNVAAKRNVMREIKLAHVLVPGTPQRMHVAELVIDRERGIVARGKANEPQVAMHLCGMHAELLMDHHSIPLFPDDPAKQSEHAMHALENGRWAPGFNFDLLPPELQETLLEKSGSAGGGAAATAAAMPLLSGVTGPPGDEVPVPAPLKQLSGGLGDAEGLPALSRAQHRSVSERIVMLHNELANACTEMQECNPSAAMMRECVRALRHFQLHGRAFYRSHYVVTQMGEQYRATLVLVPTLESMGRVRGGVGVGRSPQHAVEICALHAVDVLCTLGIPVYTNDPEKQRALADARRALGLTYCYHDCAGAEIDAATASTASPGSHARDLCRMKVPPGLQLIEALGESRQLAPAHLVRSIQQQVIRNFDVVKKTDTEIIDQGNKEKLGVMAYLTRTGQYCKVEQQPQQASNVKGQPQPQMKEVGVTPFSIQLGIQKNSLHLHCVVAMEFKIFAYIAQPSGKQQQQQQQDAGSTQPGPLFDLQRLTEVRTVVAYGASLKRRDADRMCFMHAAEILRRHGIDVDGEEASAVAEKRRIKAAQAAALVAQQQAAAKTKRLEAQRMAEAARAAIMAVVVEKRRKQLEEEAKKKAAQQVVLGGKAKAVNAPAAASAEPASGAKVTMIDVLDAQKGGDVTATAAAEPAAADAASADAGNAVDLNSAAAAAVQPASAAPPTNEQQRPLQQEVVGAEEHARFVESEKQRMSRIALPIPFMHRLLSELLQRQEAEAKARAHKARMQHGSKFI